MPITILFKETIHPEQGESTFHAAVVTDYTTHHYINSSPFECLLDLIEDLTGENVEIFDPE